MIVLVSKQVQKGKSMQKRITFDSVAHDYEIYVNDTFLGYASSTGEANDIADEYINSRLRRAITVIPVSTILDNVVQVVDSARVTVTDKSWNAAIDSAYDYILTQDAIVYNNLTEQITVNSATRANKTYFTNGTCTCEAAQKGIPCWHRALARIVKRALEINN